MRAVLIVLITLGLTGCALTHPTDPYGPPIRSLAAPPGAEAMPSTAELPEGPLDLNKAIEIALANNPDVAAAGWEVDAAQAQKDIAFGERLPSLHAVGGYRTSVNDERLVPQAKPNDPATFGNETLSGDLVLKMPLFTGGRIINTIRAAELLRSASERRLARTREELVFNVSSTFHTILGQKKVIESLAFSRKAMEEQARRTQVLFEAQKAARVDLLRTSVRQADLLQKIVQAESLLAIQKRILINLLGVENSGTQVDPAGELQLTAVQKNLESYLSDAFQNREDLAAARLNLEAQARKVDAARAERWPVLSLTGSYGERRSVDPTVVQKDAVTRTEANESENVGFAGIILDIPLFEGGRIAARIRREEAILYTNRENLRKLELKIRLEVETAFANVISARERVQATGAAIAQAEESLRIEGLKYEMGKGAIVDILDAQSALLGTQTSHFQALAEFNTAVAQLRFATGKTRGTTETPYEPKSPHF